MSSKFKEAYSEAIRQSREHNNQALIYRIGEALLSIPLNEVVDVLESVEKVKVPGSAEFFKGFFSYEGKPVIILDVPRVLSLPCEEPDAIMIVRLLGGDMFGLLITGIVQIIPQNDSWERYQPVETDMIHPIFIEQAFNINQNIVYQLKLNRLFSKGSQ